jgi:tetratricopeptide (TPR) repeat protein
MPRLAAFGRRVSWSLGARARRAWGWLATWWRPVLLFLGLAATALGLWLGNHVFHFWPERFVWWKTLGAYGLLVLVVWALRARRRVIVETFVDYRVRQGAPGEAADGQEQPIEGDHRRTPARGLATLLVFELGRLHELYRTVDEQRAIGTAAGVDRSIDAAVKVQDVAGFLQGAVSAESRISFGPVQVPVGAVFGLIGRIAQGPRIIGSVYEQDGRTILVAQKVGVGKPLSWSVDDSTPLAQTTKEQATHPSASPDTVFSSDGILGEADREPQVGEHERGLHDMMAELACRIFTDLALAGSLRWKAVQSFTEGLRVYRECLPTRKDRTLKLRDAERHFSVAISEINSFDLALYNLGVVYQELGQPEAAESAFLKAIEANPQRWQPYYALGQIRYERGDRRSVPRWCQRVIELNRADPRAHDLLGLALLDPGGRGEFDATTIRSVELQRGVKSLERAVKFAWRAMCKSAPGPADADRTGGAPHARLRQIARETLLDLALAYNACGTGRVRGRRPDRLARRYFRWSEIVFRQALFVDPNTATVRFEFGKAAEAWGRRDIALRQYEDAAAINPDGEGCAEYWAYLAKAYADNDRVEDADFACESVFVRAIDVLLSRGEPPERHWAVGTNRVLERVGSVYEQIEKPEQAERVTGRQGVGGLKAFLSEVAEEASRKPPEAAALLERRRRMAAERGDELGRWEHAHACAALADVHKRANELDEADQAYCEAIAFLEGTSASRWRGLRTELRLRRAMLLDDRGKRLEALREAQDALVRAPLGTGREVLPATRDSRPLGMAGAPADATGGRAMERLGTIRARLGKKLGTMYLDLEEFEQARAVLEDTLLWQPDDGEMHLLLGECHWRLAANYRRHPDRSRSELLFAEDHLLKAMDLSPVEDRGRSHYWLGRLYGQSGDQTKAINHFRVTESELASDGGTGPLNVSLFLAEAYFRNSWFNECDQKCRQLIAACESTLDDYSRQSPEWKRALGRRIGHETNDPFSVGAILGWAHWLLAYSYAERRVRSEDGLTLLRRAGAVVKWLDDDDDRLRCESAIADCKGWHLLQVGKIDEALASLEVAASLSADAEPYLHLALTCERKAHQATNADEQTAWLSRARDHALQVKELTWARNHLDVKADELLDRLSRVDIAAPSANVSPPHRTTVTVP